VSEAQLKREQEEKQQLRKDIMEAERELAERVSNLSNDNIESPKISECTYTHRNMCPCVVLILSIYWNQYLQTVAVIR
jgi:hypothetical protein